MVFFKAVFIGPRRSTIPTPHGYAASPLAPPTPAAVSTATSMFALFGLFNYLTIYLFNYWGLGRSPSEINWISISVFEGSPIDNRCRYHHRHTPDSSGKPAGCAAPEDLERIAGLGPKKDHPVCFAATPPFRYAVGGEIPLIQT